METDRLAMLRAICAGFDRHDLEAILEQFADDAVFEAPRGPEVCGRRFEGKDAIREAFAGRFSTIPDVRYTDDTHFVAGEHGVSRWTISGRSMVRGWRSTAATSGRFAATRSSRRIRTGSSGPGAEGRMTAVERRRPIRPTARVARRARRPAPTRGSWRPTRSQAARRGRGTRARRWRGADGRS
jgi:SnoaL-like protein